MTSPSTGRGGTIVSAVLGVLALLACLAVIVLTDDDLDVPSGGVPTGGGLISGDGEEGGVRAGTDAADGTVRADVEAAPSPSECTDRECPQVGPPTKPAGTFPYPPGTTDPVWTDDFCAGIWTSGTKTVRQVPGSLDQIRDWYLTHLLDAGYGWGAYGPVRANPFTKDDAGNEVVLGWDGSLTTSDESVTGRLAIERAYGRQTVCGPAEGVIFIRVELR